MKLKYLGSHSIIFNESKIVNPGDIEDVLDQKIIDELLLRSDWERVEIQPQKKQPVKAEEKIVELENTSELEGL